MLIPLFCHVLFCLVNVCFGEKKTELVDGASVWSSVEGTTIQLVTHGWKEVDDNTNMKHSSYTEGKSRRELKYKMCPFAPNSWLKDFDFS